MTFSPDDEIIFTPGEVRENKPGQRRGTFIRYLDNPDTTGTIVVVTLSGDPFSVCVYEKQIKPLTDKEKNMPTTTARPRAKELRRKAKALGVEGWEDMSLAELEDAVTEAEEEEETPRPRKATKKSAPAKKSTTRRAAADDDDEDEDDEDEDDEDDDEDDEEEAPRARKTTKKTAAKKTATKKSTPAKKATATKKSAPAKKSAAKKTAAPAREEAENGNPYAEGTNLWYMAEALIKGGKVSTLVKNLRKRVEIKPRSRDYDEDSLNAELQRRLIIVSQHLRNDYGFEMEKDGRGWDATIRCFKE